MNGFRNAIFILVGLITLIGIGLSFTIGTQLVDGTYIAVFADSPTAHIIYQDWLNIRDFFINLTYNLLVPLIIFLVFASSFINRNANIIMYITQCFIVLLITPILIYTFADLLTPFIQVGLIDVAYIRALYFENFLMLMVVNMILSFASFLFTNKGASNATFG